MNSNTLAKQIATLILFLMTNFLFAQAEWKNIDFTYLDNIRTVTLLPDQTVLATNSVSTSRFKTQTTVSGTLANMDSVRQRNLIAELPIFKLNGGTVTLNFDDMEGDSKYYRYKIVYCNADWSQSALSDLEYIQGYSEDRIPNGRVSFGMLTNYMNYRLTLPNQNTRFTKSGNYILHIYVDDSENTLVLTRRFCIYEDLLTLKANFPSTGKTEKSDTHHEIDFTATYKNINIRNPQREIKAAVIQNSNWATGKYNLTPSYYLQGELNFDYQDSIVFPAGKEYRPIDLRSLIFTRGNVQHIASFKDGYDVTLKRDIGREKIPYSFTFDVNGGFVISNLDLAGDIDPDIQCEYPDVLFTLVRNKNHDDSDIYVVGKMTDWQLYDTFKMSYSQSKGAYTLEVPIKQGYYDYTYAIVNKDGKMNLAEIDGDWYETENNYSILTYYRSVGDRYDRLVGYKMVNSLFDRKK
jgi:hypothetical protein